MDWLNYHHLRYFWTAAKEGSVKQAAAKLHVSQPSVSEQIRELEDALGEKLFRREGRGLALTDAGRIAYGYADDIFALGQELVNAVKQRPTAKALSLHVGVADSFPKLMTNEILKPVFALPQSMHVICREGKLEDLLAQLEAHRLDIVLADEPATSATRFKAFNHPLGDSGTTFCAAKALAARLRRQFPKSLHDAPALLPSENTALRRALEGWFRRLEIRPRVVAEFEDLALMKVMAAEGRGFIAVPSVAAEDALQHYGFQAVGVAEECRVQFHAITAERRMAHPGVAAITNQSSAALS
ncbi:MAG TPA: LysR family transcriptional regulator [Verrucomicrobiae bacterium]